MPLEPTNDRERARTTAATTETNASTSHAWETFTTHSQKIMTHPTRKWHQAHSHAPDKLAIAAPNRPRACPTPVSARTNAMERVTQAPNTKVCLAA
jgi:hypothetical protein